MLYFGLGSHNREQGLAEPGKGAELAKSGATALPRVRNEKMKGKFAFELPVNAGGGLIADGHPVGATGARLILTSLKELKRRRAKRALVSLCVGGGQGAALWLERN